jgi:hypothetical protein
LTLLLEALPPAIPADLDVVVVGLLAAAFLTTPPFFKSFAWVAMFPQYRNGAPLPRAFDYAHTIHHSE